LCFTEIVDVSKLIAIVDDEPDIVELVALHLKKAGFGVEEFLDGESFVDRLEGGHEPDLIILDLMLPDRDGYEICKDLKRNEDTATIPIIMLTARGEEMDKVLGLELGADDYVTKPFSPKELVARVKAVLRRHEQKVTTKRIKIDDVLVVDIERHTVTVGGKTVILTPTEFRILQLLVTRRGWVYSRDQILEYLWGQEKMVVDRTVDVHIKNLRDKLGMAAGLIKNVRGIGYKLEN
jgi:two-component system phosphate regulon response regulator PhoB/two-component system alkaline phosphatase synthesis response regulator PhoP